MANLGANFYPKLVQISSELGMQPEDLLTVMVSESGVNPGAFESKFHGSGLLGFMPDTLKGLGYQGTWRDFTQLTGQDQLDYVKKLVQNNMRLNGGPFTSAAQYYVANLWPVALKLPGIRQGDPQTAFIEANPQTVSDPQTGKQYSKKYYDLGFRISPSSEAAAYKYNPLFHGSVPGAITYGDMMKQVDKTRQTPTYQKVLAALKQSGGGQPDKDDLFQSYLSRYKDQGDDIFKELGTPKPPAPAASPATTTPQATVPATSNDLDNVLTKYLQQVSSSEKSNKRLYKKFLPTNHLVIGVQADNYTDAVEFSRILCSVLDEELMANAYTYTNGQVIEVGCKIAGPLEDCAEAVKELAEATSEAFQLATAKIGGIKIKTGCIMNKKSSYQQIDIKSANSQYRKFLLKFIKDKKW